MKHDSSLARCKLLEWQIGRHSESCAKCLEHRAADSILKVGPQFEHAFSQRKSGIRDHKAEICTRLNTDSFTR